MVHHQCPITPTAAARAQVLLAFKPTNCAPLDLDAEAYHAQPCVHNPYCCCTCTGAACAQAHQLCPTGPAALPPGRTVQLLQCRDELAECAGGQGYAKVGILL